MQPVPIGVPGELYIGGVGLARGYYGDQQQTQAKFLPNPFASLLPNDNAQRAMFGNRIYKTGDLVRYMPNGEMEYIGRTDFQVKLRGLRIELGEIETAISQFAGVRQAVVMVVDGPQEKENKLLVAYVVPEVDETALRTHVSNKVPVYMMPQVFMMMAEFPMNTSGKVERKLLPVPKVHTGVRLEPRNDKERILLEVWSKVLNIKPEQIGVDDMFFSLGGDSITAVTLAYHAKQRGLIITTQQVLSHQTIPAQAAVCELVDPGNAIEKQVPWGTAHLSPVQQWIFNGPLRIAATPVPGSSKPRSFNQYALLQFQQPLDVALVSRALGHLLMVHPALRATFDNAKMTMTFTEPTREETEKLTLGIHRDQSPLCEVHVIQAGETLSDDFANKWEAHLNPTQGVCVRGVLIASEGAAELQKLLLVVHHLCVDKVSWSILLADLQTILAQLHANAKVNIFSLPSPSLPFSSLSQLTNTIGGSS
jgi:hypothetical protein